MGFALIVCGVLTSFFQPNAAPAAVAAASGVISEFIGVTFLAIHRSTMAQANKFMAVLERINTVGMAVQILDAIPEAETALKNSTRAQIVALLLEARGKGQE
jgi:membrane associated rhomboid family serine protease